MRDSNVQYKRRNNTHNSTKTHNTQSGKTKINRNKDKIIKSICRVIRKWQIEANINEITYCTVHTYSYVNINQFHRRSSLHFPSFHFTSLPFTSHHFTSLHVTSLPFTPFHFTSLHFTSLPFTSLHFTSLHTISHHFTSHHFTSLPFPSHRFPSLHITSLYITSLHFTPLHFTSLQTLSSFMFMSVEFEFNAVFVLPSIRVCFRNSRTRQAEEEEKWF